MDSEHFSRRNVPTFYNPMYVNETHDVSFVGVDRRITWCGGMTKVRRIVALAAAYDVPIIPHGSSMYSYHLQICYPNCPMAEFLVMNADSIGEAFELKLQRSFPDRASPSDPIFPIGFNVVFWESLHGRANAKEWLCALPHDKPGFGVTLNS